MPGSLRFSGGRDNREDMRFYIHDGDDRYGDFGDRTIRDSLVDIENFGPARPVERPTRPKL